MKQVSLLCDRLLVTLPWLKPGDASSYAVWSSGPTPCVIQSHFLTSLHDFSQLNVQEDVTLSCESGLPMRIQQIKHTASGPSTQMPTRLLASERTSSTASTALEVTARM